MSEERVRYTIVLLTARHSIAGELLFRGQRLSDFLNDRRETVVSLLDATIARLDEPSKVLQKQPAAVVPKSWVEIAFEPPQSAIPPAHRFFGYVKKEAQEVFLLMEGLEIRGTLHTPSDLDLRRIITPVEHGFLPITKAIVTLTANHKYVIEQDAIMVNSARIKYIGKAGPRIPSP